MRMVPVSTGSMWQLLPSNHPPGPRCTVTCKLQPDAS